MKCYVAACALLFVLGTACQSGTGDTTDRGSNDTEGGEPAFEGVFETAQAEDADPDPDVVEISLEAREAQVELSAGRKVPLWTYNGVLPGPRIEAKVGDRIVVHLKNSLPEATTIHWHGLRLPAAMDGVAVTQSPIEPGESFTYEFDVKDAGTFWYHPHVRSDEQVERGLYGAIVVRGPAEPESDSDRVVVLDDVLVDENWNLAPFDPMQAMAGREGNVILANGHVSPAVQVARGGLHRFRFVNAANARYFRIALPGHRLIVLGKDSGLLEAPQQQDEVLLVPGQRADVVVRAQGDAGETLTFRSLVYDRGHETAQNPEVTLFRLRYAAEEVRGAPELPATLASIEPLSDATLAREIKLEETEMAAGHGGHGGDSGGSAAPVFSINGEVFPDVTPLAAKLGSVEEWSIVNTTEMDHPFHLHGFRFQVMSVNGTPPPFGAWEDTINIPAKQTVTMRVPLEEHAGTWMFHCHILEHAERGMAGELVVSP